MRTLFHIDDFEFLQRSIFYWSVRCFLGYKSLRNEAQSWPVLGTSVTYIRRNHEYIRGF